MKLLFFIGLLGMGFQAFSAGAATVLYTYKTVQVNSNDGQRALSRGASLNPGDTITTSADALVNIKYTNGTLVNLGENSSYTIVAYNPKQSEIEIKARLNMGKLRLKTTGKTQEEITTPIVALGILGTDASIYIASTSSVYVNVTEGKVEGKGTPISAGDSVLIDNSGVTPTPFPQEGNVTPPEGALGTISGSPSSNSDVAKVLGVVETVALTTTETVGVTTSIVTTTETIPEVAQIVATCP